MSVVVQSGSKQYIINLGQKFIVDRLDINEGETLDLPVIFGFGDEKSTKAIKAKVLKHQKGKKIRVVKFKSKSNYHKQSGYRASQTLLEFIK